MSYFSADVRFTSQVKNVLPGLGYVDVIDNSDENVCHHFSIDALESSDYTFSYEGEKGFTIVCGFKKDLDLMAKKFVFEIQGRRLPAEWWKGDESIEKSWFAVIPKQNCSGCTYLFDLANQNDNFEGSKGFFDLKCEPNPSYENIFKPGTVQVNKTVSYDVNINVFKKIFFYRPPTSRNFIVTFT
jgi:hypothetical protein